MTDIDTQLFATAGDNFGMLKSQLWTALDSEIDLKECFIFRYDIYLEISRLLTLFYAERHALQIFK